MNTPHTHRIFAALASLTLAASSAQAATVIFSDDFDQSTNPESPATTFLHGTTPDTTTGGATWSAEAAWNANGSVAGLGSGSVAKSNAFLAFTPETGKIYTLSATLTQPSGGGDSGWAAIGFANTATLDNSFWANETAPWMFWRPSTNAEPNEVVSALGNLGGNPGLNSRINEGQQTGTATLTIELNTENPVWSAEWFINGSSVRTDNYNSTGSNPPINYVGIAREAGQGTDFSAFSLTVVPEPSTALLGGFGLLALLRRRRK